jgi:hypothetical protein
MAFKSCASAAEPLSFDVGDALYIINDAPLMMPNCASSPALQSFASRLPQGKEGVMADIALRTKVARTSTTFCQKISNRNSVLRSGLKLTEAYLRTVAPALMNCSLVKPKVGQGPGACTCWSRDDAGLHVHDSIGTQINVLRPV